MEYYIDGSCKGNPGVGGWAVVITKDNYLIEKIGSFAEAPVTNNMMEITALIYCLCYIFQYKDKKPIIYTDSMYNIYCYHGATNMLKKDNLKNGPFIKTLCYLKRAIYNHGYNLKILKVKAHSNNLWNEEADRLASLCASKRCLIFKTRQIPAKIIHMMSDDNYKEKDLLNKIGKRR